MAHRTGPVVVGCVWGEQESKTWQPFQMFECRRLERAYRKHFKSLHGKCVAADGHAVSQSATGQSAR